LELDEWSTAVDFCLKGIRQYGNEGDPSSLPYASSAGQLFSTASTAHTSTSRMSIRSTPNKTSNVSIKKKNSEELMECLCSLISASNAPVLERTEDIFQGIVYFLNTQGSIVGHFHQVALSAINVMISATGAEETSVVKSLVAPVVPLISRLWSSKTAENDDMLNAAKDEMCTTLLLLRLHMEKIVQEDNSNDLEPLFRDMESTLRNDYARRLERSQLQLEDLDLTSVDDDPRSLKVGYLRLRPHNTRAERKWAVVQVLSILDGFLHKRTEISAKDAINSEADEEDHPRKRRRVAQRFDSLIDRVTEVDAGERLLALQTLFFSISNSQLLKGEIKDLVSVLTTSMLDTSTEASIWAMLCLAGLVIRLSDMLHC
jgi:ataxia telangiectasia mutated family protein